MIDEVQKIREAIEKRYEYWKEKESNSHSVETEIRMSECQHLLQLLNSLPEEPVKIDSQISKMADDFAEREYELDGYERKWLSKGYYHGYKDASKNKSEEPVSDELKEAANEAAEKAYPYIG